MARRPFAFALALSLLLHLSVMTAPGWRLPESPEVGPALLEAQIVTSPPRPAVAASPPPRPKTVPKPRHAPPRPPMAALSVPQVRAPGAEPSLAVKETPSPPPDQKAGEAGAAQAGGASPAPPPSAAGEDIDVLLPGEGRIRFDVLLGSKGFVVGQAVATWHLDDKTYAIRNAAETVGLVSLFKRAKVTQTSEGRVSAAGLVPQDYLLVRDDPSKVAEAVHFDWTERKVTSLREGRQKETELLDGSHDLLSLIYQLAWFPPQASLLEIPVATGKRYSLQRFEVLGEETIAIRMGRFRTMHLRVGRSGENITEIWLGLDYKNLPLRIRHAAKDGDTYEQQAVDVRYGDVKISAPPGLTATN
jgi:hypothetical protein